MLDLPVHNKAKLSAHTSGNGGNVPSDLAEALKRKQNKLVPGDGITIDETTNTISVNKEADLWDLCSSVYEYYSK